MTDRLRLPWQFAFACAALGVMGGCGIALRLFLSGSARPLAAIIPLPAVWLAAAAYFGRDGGRSVRGLTVAAGVYTAVVNTWLALLVVPWVRSRLPARLAGHPAWHEEFILAEFPLALVVFVSNAVGCWRRRHDRRTAVDPDA